ncbi:MAG: redoxin family protein [Deltaproteobacteria bacterium]|nr:redoxin family protein [Deltaproteobacteria bacterium]
MKKSYYVAILIAVIVMVMPPVQGFAGNKVLPIGTKDIQEMIASQDCPLFLVATAAWCGPCREELPVLNKLFHKYKDRGLKLVAVSMDIDLAPMQRLVDKLELIFPVYWAGEKMYGDFMLFGVPTILVVRDGKIQERIIGSRDETFLERKITSLMTEACAP